MLPDETSNPKILDEFEAKGPILKAFCASVQRLLGELLQSENLQVPSIAGRVKTRESLAEKITRPDKQYKKLVEVTDVVGLRVVTFFEDDVDKVAKMLEREFDLVTEYCVDKRAYVEPDKFGYRSLHYVCRLSEPRRSLTENASFSNELFEVQVRSILQHAWAEIEHDLGYKGAVKIPNEIKRQLSIVSGLLELADRDFREVRDKTNAYRQKVAEDLKADASADLKLDSISMSEFMATSEEVKELDAYLQNKLGFPLVPDTDHEITLYLLQQVGITTIEELKSALSGNLEFLKRYGERVLADHFMADGDACLRSGLSVFHLPQIIVARRGIDELAKLYLDARIAPPGTQREEATEIVQIVNELDSEC